MRMQANTAENFITKIQVNMNYSDTMDLSNFADKGEWELVAVSVRRNMVTDNCCHEPFPRCHLLRIFFFCVSPLKG